MRIVKLNYDHEMDVRLTPSFEWQLLSEPTETFPYKIEILQVNDEVMIRFWKDNERKCLLVIEKDSE